MELSRRRPIAYQDRSPKNLHMIPRFDWSGRRTGRLQRDVGRRFGPRFKRAIRSRLALDVGRLTKIFTVLVNPDGEVLVRFSDPSLPKLLARAHRAVDRPHIGTA